MQNKTPNQQSFFKAVRDAKHNPNAPSHLRQVAESMPDSDLDAFADKVVTELKMKKAMLGILKDVREQIEIREPMYLQEDDEEQADIEAIADQFPVQENWAKYIKPYVGQPLSSKELDALGNFKEKQPVTTARTEIWYKSKDNMGLTHTTVIRKMKDSGQFSYIAFQKQKSPETPPENPQDKTNTDGQEPEMGGLGGLDGGLGGLGGGGEPQPEMGGLGGPPEAPQGEAPPGSTNPPPAQQQQAKEKAEGKENIIVTKSILFKDDIKGAAILIDFLKNLDL
jgi:hypothetical protein